MKGRLSRIGRVTTVLTLVVAMLVLSIGIAFAAIQRVRATDDNRWRPPHPYVEKGTRVRWVNNTNVVHNVKARDNGTNWNYFRTISPGESVSRRFRRVGDYYFKCTLHADTMLGGIHVRRNV